MPQRKCSGAGPRGRGTEHTDKLCAGEVVAHPAALTPAGLAVLQVLARLRHPLSPKEIAQRSGLPRRTVHYWLSKFLRLGYVERIGRARSPGVVYALTREGRRALTSARFSCCTVPAGQARAKPRSRSGGGSRVEPVALPLGVVLDGSAGGRLEVGVRAPYPLVRGYLRGLGVRMPRRRVKSVVYYASGGRVHCDMPVSPGVLSAVDDLENALLLLLQRVWLSLVVAAAVLTAVGVPREVVVAAVAGVQGRLVHQLAL